MERIDITNMSDKQIDAVMEFGREARKMPRERFETLRKMGAMDRVLRMTSEESDAFDAWLEIEFADALASEDAERERKEKSRKDREDNFCRKCGGSGTLEAFRHIERGICFRCGGSGVEPIAP